jgi:hypothetical protein
VSVAAIPQTAARVGKGNTTNYNQCTETPRDSLGLAQAGHPLLPQSRQIAPDGLAEHIVPKTRNALCQRGVNLATGLEGELQVGDIIAVYVEDSTEPMMLSQIIQLQHTITNEDAVYSWMGQMEVGDEVISVHKLDPTANGIIKPILAVTRPCKGCFTVPNLD